MNPPETPGNAVSKLPVYYQLRGRSFAGTVPYGIESTFEVSDVGLQTWGFRTRLNPRRPR